MRCLAWVCVCLLVAIPAVALDKQPALQFAQPVPQAPAPGNYKAPKADGPVVALLDEGVDPLFPVLINDGGGEAGTVAREDRDVFSGVEAVRVTPMQKYRTTIPGWSYKIVETPKNAGEFRYLRFAWKKIGGSGMMIQFHDVNKSWGIRYVAGRNVFGWIPVVSVSEKVPEGWEVVTRDLFKDYGAFTITGVALSPLEGTAGLFDHMLLGRSVADLDTATDAARGKLKPAKALEKQEREAFWDNLLGEDRVKAATALRELLASAPDHVAFIEERLGKIALKKEDVMRITKLLADLDADSFEVRHAATEELIKLGGAATDAVRALATSATNDEVRYRAKLILRKLEGGEGPVSSAGRLSRVVRILERANTGKARDLLAKMAEGQYGFDVATDAKAALTRLPKTP
jgi:hypothetical protein